MIIEQLKKTDTLNIEPNFIYNRYDLLNDKKSLILRCFDSNNTYDVTALIDNNDAEIGLYLRSIPTNVVIQIVKYIFANYKEVNKISIKNSLKRIKFCYFNILNHFNLEIPKNEEDLNNAMSKNEKQTIKRKTNSLLKEQGQFVFNQYEKYFPNYLTQAFFNLKKKNTDIENNFDTDSYFNNYNVSNIYTMSLNDKIIAMILSCEQCPIVYFENTTYDVEYSKYSLGIILYDYYLRQLITHDKKGLYLGGGTYRYKKMYNSNEIKTYCCYFYRNPFKNIFMNIYGLILNGAIFVYHTLLKKITISFK